MNPRVLAVFAAGLVIGALIASLMLRPARRERTGGVWRERAETSERELAVAKRHLDSLANELRRLNERFDALTSRLEAVEPTTPAAPN